jgi:hypothetical protein
MRLISRAPLNLSISPRLRNEWKAFRVGNGDGEGSRAVVITANAGGASWTPDEGDTWFSLPGVTGYWAVVPDSQLVSR